MVMELGKTIRVEGIRCSFRATWGKIMGRQSPMGAFLKGLQVGAVISVLLSGCATTANYEKILNSWVGTSQILPRSSLSWPNF